MSDELKQLFEFVREHKHLSVQEAIDEFFKPTIWSLAKEEYYQRMYQQDRERFIRCVEKVSRGK